MEAIQENYQEVPAMECEIDGQENDQREELPDETVMEEPSEETTDKNELNEDHKIEPKEEIMDTSGSFDQLDEHESIVRMEEKLLLETRVKSEETEHKSDSSCRPEDQDAGVELANTNSPIDEDDQSEADSKDDDTDKGSEGKSQTNDQDQDQEGTSQLDDQSASLGRNRRVRQKNRYFLDFHCTDLTKGGRSNKFDYEPTTTSTRSSNRKSSNELHNSQTEDPDKLPHVYCRKCRQRTPYSEDGGCQVCIYNRIVESYNKKAIHKTQKSKSKHQSQQDDTKPAPSKKSSSSSSSKRKSTKQSGSRSQSHNKNSGNNNSKISTTNNLIITIKNTDNVECDSVANQTNIKESNDISKPQEVTVDDIKLKTLDKVDAGQHVLLDVAATDDASGGPADADIPDDDSWTQDDLPQPRLDIWTPEEVADFMERKGFPQEAKLFLTQSVDGISLILMQRTDFTYGLKIKLGPALKIYDHVCKLKKEHFKRIFNLPN